MPDNQTLPATISPTQYYLTKPERHSFAMLLAADQPLSGQQAGVPVSAQADIDNWWPVQAGLVALVYPHGLGPYQLVVVAERAAEMRQALLNAPHPASWRPTSAYSGFRSHIYRVVFQIPRRPELIFNLFYGAVILYFALYWSLHYSLGIFVIFVVAGLILFAAIQTIVWYQYAHRSATPTRVRTFLRRAYLVSLVYLIMLCTALIILITRR